jgi:GNAT superfamily N-acetyltransferase
MKIRIREATKNDWKFILKLRNQESSRLAFFNTSTVDCDTHVSYMTKLTNNPTDHHWIIVFDDKDVGYIKIVNTELGSNLLDGYRRKGIGTAAYKLVFEEAKKLGFKKLNAEVKIDRPIPLTFEEKTGWKKIKLIYKNKKPYSYKIERILD